MFEGFFNVSGEILKMKFNVILLLVVLKFSNRPIKSKIPSNIENKKQNCQLKIWNKIKFDSACSGLSPELYQSSFMDNITCVWAGAKRTKGPL